METEDDIINCCAISEPVIVKSPFIFWLPSTVNKPKL